MVKKHLRVVDPSDAPAFVDYIPTRVDGDPTIAELGERLLTERLSTPSFPEMKSLFRKHIEPSLGAYRVSQVSKDWAAGFIRWKHEAERLSSTRLNSILWVARQLVDAALPGVANPFRQVNLQSLRIKKSEPKVDMERQTHFPENATRLISSELIPFQRRALYAVGIFAGLRKAELMALRWGDLSSADPLRRLTCNRQYRYRQRKVRDRKAGGVARVPVHPELDDILSEWRELWGERFGQTAGAGDLIFPRVRRRRLVSLHPDRILEDYRTDLTVLGIMPPGESWRFHGLRHSFATLAVNAGANEKAIFACTHRPGPGIQNRYRHWRWPTLCEAVSAIPVQRISQGRQSAFPIDLGPISEPSPEPETTARRKWRRKPKQLELGLEPE